MGFNVLRRLYSGEFVRRAKLFVHVTVSYVTYSHYTVGQNRPWTTFNRLKIWLLYILSVDNTISLYTVGIKTHQNVFTMSFIKLGRFRLN
jgi:hypothetical protein